MGCLLERTWGCGCIGAPGFDDFPGRVTRSSTEPPSELSYIQQKDAERDQPREEVPGLYLEDSRQELLESSPGETHRTDLILP